MQDLKRRQIALPSFCVDTLRRRWDIQQLERSKTGESWVNTRCSSGLSTWAQIMAEQINEDHEEAFRKR
jgi:hypothetical protein